MPPRAKSTTDGGGAAVAPAPKQPVRRQPRVIGPGYVEELKAYSRLLFDGGLTGSKEHKRPETVAAVIEVGRDIGLNPTQAVASVAIVNGRPTIYGDAGLALIRSSGLLEGDIDESFEGEPGTMEFTAVCSMKRVGAPKPRVTRFSVADAVKANLWGKSGPWTQYPERMLMWRARSWTCRDEFGDVLAGLIFVEEARDIPRQVETETVATGTVEDRMLLARAKGQSLNELASVITASTTPPQAAPVTPPLASPPVPVQAAESTEVATPPTTRTPITEPQLAELARLRLILLTGKGLDPENEEHDEQIKTAWLEVLADFGEITSARQLSAGQAAELIETLGEKVEPFSYPPKRGG